MVIEGRSSADANRRAATACRSGFAPLIKEAWYVIAAREDVDHSLHSITVVNQPLVYFRAEDGTPVVLDDRCAHRRYSLSKSRLKGDTVECGYHGFTYDRSGACIFAPGVSRDLNFGVRDYTAAERGLWLWVWMGDGPADVNDIPLPQIADVVSDGIHGYTYNRCNYLLLHENLLDLTHLHYLHGPGVADAVYANTAPTVLTSPDNNSVGHGKTVASTGFRVPGLFCGADPNTLVRQVEEIWSCGPALNYGDLHFYLPDGSPASPHRQVVLHAITPETESTTHQFWTVRFDAPLVGAKDELVSAVQGIFSQDVEALAIQSQNIACDTRSGVVENSIPSDVASLKLRRILQRLAAEEQPDRVATGG
jgi:phenylpropionate dioxygenase-like ring-hydroxylating dioxygenase large terminal subunit